MIYENHVGIYSPLLDDSKPAFVIYAICAPLTKGAETPFFSFCVDMVPAAKWCTKPTFCLPHFLISRNATGKLQHINPIRPGLFCVIRSLGAGAGARVPSLL